MRVTGSINLLLAASALLLMATASAEPMSDELRNTVSRIVILPVPGESNENITGTYGEQTEGLAGGMAKGAGKACLLEIELTIVDAARHIEGENENEVNGAR